MRRVLGLVLLSGLGSSCGPTQAEVGGSSEEARARTQSALSTAQKQARSSLIKAAAAQVGVTNALVVAGIANHESGLAQCWSEASWHCHGPWSADCGGPVLAGSGDGPCSQQQGGLGMFQLDSGSYAQTVAAWGPQVVSVAGNTQAGIEIILHKLKVCPSSQLTSTEAAIDFLNRAHPGTAEFETFLTTMAWCYNGCAPSYTSCSHLGIRESYRAGVTQLVNALGATFWTQSAAARAQGSSRVGANSDGRLEVFLRGQDGASWHRWQLAEGGWSGWSRLGGAHAGPAAVGSNADGRLEAFSLAAGGALQHRYQLAEGGWAAGWSALGGWALAGEVAVGSNQDGRLELFGRTGDGRVWQKWQVAPNSGWSDWVEMGGIAAEPLTVGRNADGRLELFAVGGDGALWHRWQWAPSSAWSDWAALGGQLAGRPAVARSKGGRLNVFVRGADGKLWVIAQTAAGWSGFHQLSEHPLGSPPAVGQNDDGRLEVFARAASGELVHLWELSPDGAWSGLGNLGGQLSEAAPQVARNADGRLEVFALGADGQVWHVWQVAPSSGWSGWASFGFWPDGL